MTAPDLVVIAGILTVIAALAGVGVVSAILLWSVRTFPAGQIRSKVSELGAMVDNLEAQIIKLRTQKAASRSPRAGAVTPEPQSNPLFPGLTPEERAFALQAGLNPDTLE